MRLCGGNLLSWGIFALIYGALALICLQARDPWSLSSFIWLPAGITLSVLCMTRWQYWPIWLVISSTLHTAISLMEGRSFDLTAIFTLSDVLIITCIALLWRVITRRSFMFSYSGLNSLFILSVIVLCFAGGLILYLFISMSYPVTLSHSVVWAVSESSGILTVSSYFTFVTMPFRRPQFRGVINLRGIINWMLAAGLAVGSYNLGYVTGNSTAITLTATNLLLFLTVLTALFKSAVHTAAYIQFCALMVSLAALYHTGPFIDTEVTGTGVFLSQIYLLFLSLIASITYARMADLRLAYNVNTRIQDFFVKHAPFNSFFRFSFFPDEELLHWNDRFPLESHNKMLLSSPALLMGRLREEDQPQLRAFFHDKASFMEQSGEQVFSGQFLNEDLVYVPFTLTFFLAEARYDNLRLEGVLVLH